MSTSSRSWSQVAVQPSQNKSEKEENTFSFASLLNECKNIFRSLNIMQISSSIKTILFNVSQEQDPMSKLLIVIDGVAQMFSNGP